MHLQITNNTLLGENVKLGDNIVINNSTICENCRIEPGAILNQVILFPGAVAKQGGSIDGIYLTELQ